MKVLILSPYPDPIAGTVIGGGDEPLVETGKITLDDLSAAGVDFVVSYGYKHMVAANVLARFDGRAVNLHISHLPWNRGYYPNLWSFLEGTPKGVTIHHMDEGIDTGDIIAQRRTVFPDRDTETLASTYEILRRDIEALFRETWPAIRDGRAPRFHQEPTEGNHHFKREAERIWPLLPDAWNTPVCRVEKLGVELGLSGRYGHGGTK